jgi:hypothetical protein
LEAIAAHKEAQWLVMMTWMHESEQKWVTRHKDDKLCAAGIISMITTVLNGVASAQEASKKERYKTAKMDIGGLEALQHADTTPERGPDKHQQLPQLQQQPKPKPKLQLKLQPKLQHKPRPKSAPTTLMRWETIPPRAKSRRAPGGLVPRPDPGPALTTGLSMAERHLILIER